ncbi:MAG: hypothetical protein JST82_12720 [Bacteroidetes bacterium]|nr:hypothetical protein [Bacteroidota bacterium]
MQFITFLDYLLLPFYIIIVYLIAFKIRDTQYPPGHPWRKHFITGLNAKIIGAVLIGLIYQYYYKGGDTLLYFHHASIINKAWSESIDKWVNLLFHIPPWYQGEYSEYISKMEWYESPTEYIVCQITAFISFFTFTTYLPTAVLYGAISYTGLWALFRTFATKYPQYIKQVAICALYIPSTIMWGSGIFKDTICMFGLGWLTYGAFRLLINRDFRVGVIIMTAVSFYLVASIKLYILLAFIPALVLWILFTYSYKIRSSGARFMLKIVVLFAAVGGFLVFSQRFAASLGKYSLDNVSKTAYNTHTFIASVSKDEGSKYDLGELDPSIGGMLKKFPKAVNVSLFRPYIWETRKPIQLLNAIEAMFFLWVTIKILITIGLKQTWRTINSDPTIQFCLIFSIIFAFAVGISSGNFGTLSRYRIPCLPFYALALMLIYYRHNPTSKNILSFRLRG